MQQTAEDSNKAVGPRKSPWNAGKLALAVWFVVGTTYWLTRLATSPAVQQYLTYWSLGFELAILGYMIVYELRFYTDERCTAKPNLGAASASSEIPSLYQKQGRAAVLLVGPYVGTATMVFVGSVYISVDAAVSLARMLPDDPTMAISNLVTHTLPFVTGIVMLAAYAPDIRRNTAHLRWCPLLYGNPYPESLLDGKEKDGGSSVAASANSPRAKAPGCDAWFIVRSAVHFWGPTVLPLVWRLVCTPEDVYHISTSAALYMMVAAALLGPSVLISATARYCSLNARNEHVK